MPKSIWWYSDCIDVGFRVVCEADSSTGTIRKYFNKEYMQNIDRRKFIGKTALAGIGLAGAGALITACKRKPDIEALGSSSDSERCTKR